MLALERVLAKAGKEVTLVLSEKLDSNLTFLPGIEKIKSDITAARDLIIRINKSKFPVDKLSYKEEDGYLNIVLTPKGTLDKNSLEFVQGDFKFDLIFVLDTADVERIDSIYDRYTELFFETPIVNVDHHNGNEYFGTVNMVDMTATSTAEILVSIIEAMGPGNFDADVATCLLTGIIADTASFKNTNTTPKSLTISAQMLAAGARQQEIIQNLYKTRPLSTLKLWGRLLSNMEYDQEHRMVVSTIGLADFTETGGNSEEIHGVMDELLAKAPGTDVVLLLAETAKGKLTGKLKGMNGSDVLVIAEAFGGSGQVLAAGFDMPNTTLAGNKEQILTKVRTIRDRQLGRAEKLPASSFQPPVTPNPTPVISTEAHFDARRAEKSTPGRSLDGTRDDNAVKTETLKQVQDDKTLETRSLIPEAADLASLDALVEQELETGSLMPEANIEPTYNDIFTPTAVTNTADKLEAVSQPARDDSGRTGKLETSAEDEITQAIKSIDDEIEGVVEETPNIDIEGVKSKKEALQQIGEVIRGYNPGQPIEDAGKQPADPSIWR
jgi:phosphoesterase RecJ-like protein